MILKTYAVKIVIFIFLAMRASNDVVVMIELYDVC